MGREVQIKSQDVILPIWLKDNFLKIIPSVDESKGNGELSTNWHNLGGSGGGEHFGSNYQSFKYASPGAKQFHLWVSTPQQCSAHSPGGTEGLMQWSSSQTSEITQRPSRKD